TVALAPGSPALGAGDCAAYTGHTGYQYAAVTTDQRGVPRGNPCDAGAFEGTVTGSGSLTLVAGWNMITLPVSPTTSLDAQSLLVSLLSHTQGRYAEVVAYGAGGWG